MDFPLFSDVHGIYDHEWTTGVRIMADTVTARRRSVRVEAIL